MNLKSVHPKTLLSIEDLSVTLYTDKVTVCPVNKVNYSVERGKVLAIVGESGSGKTVMNMAPLGLLPQGVTADVEGSVQFEGKNLLSMNEKEKQRIRGGEIGVIFQDPLSSLNPVRRIGPQITEVIELHLGLSTSAAQKQTLDMLNLVGIPNPESRMKQYPHELSGGMRQRVCIAMSIAGEPKLLIADEPTTALDVTVQAQIVSLLKDLQKRLNMSIVLITHDIGIVSGMADYLAVMYAGRLIEIGPVEKVLLESMHPYTWGLLDSVSTLSTPIGSPFQGIRGNPPNLTLNIKGCPFVPRCDYAIENCSEDRPLLSSCGDNESGHATACPVAKEQNISYLTFSGH